MPFVKISVTKKGFKSYILSGDMDCSGWFLESGPSSVNFLGQECCFLYCVRYLPEIQTLAWHRRSAMKYTWNQILPPLSVSLSLSPSFSASFPHTTSQSFIFWWILLSIFYLWWSWMQYPKQDMSPRFTQYFPSFYFFPIQYSSRGPEWTPLFT